MVSISVKAEVANAIRDLNNIAKKQIPFAVSAALNDTAFQVQRAERENMRYVFRHPRPFTANSTLVKKATQSNLVATVFVRPEVAEYLLPYEFGGVHVLPGPALLNPKDIRLDQYGQLTKGTPARIKGNPNVFIGTIKNITGFWLRTKKRVRGKTIKGVKLLIRLGNALPVTEHLNFRKRGLQVVQAVFPQAAKKAFARAVASMKRP